MLGAWVPHKPPYSKVWPGVFSRWLLACRFRRDGKVAGLNLLLTRSRLRFFKEQPLALYCASLSRRDPRGAQSDTFYTIQDLCFPLHTGNVHATQARSPVLHAKTHKSGTSLPSRGAEEREADCSNRDHALLKKPSGTMDRHFRDGLLVQQANSGPPEGLNFKLSVVNGLAPREQVETLLVAQMAEVHAAMMRFTAAFSSRQFTGAGPRRARVQ
jgi:hypothetical protein